MVSTSGEEVLVLNPGSGARNLAVAEVRLKGEKGRAGNLSGADVLLKEENDSPLTVVAKSGHLIPVDENPSPGKFTRRFRRDRSAILAFANREVGRLENALVSADALFGSSALTDLIHRVQLESTGADISFAAPLSVSGSIDAGMLYVRDLFKMYRYENFLYTMRLTGNEIHRYLEYSYGLWFNQMQSEEDHLLLVQG